MRRKRATGFTLFEMLVVIAVMGVVTTMGGAIFFRISDAWRVNTVRTELDARAESAFSEMRRDFEAIISADLTDVALEGVPGDTETPLLEGLGSLPDDLVRLPVLLQRGGAEGLYEPFLVEYRVDVGDAGAALLRRQKPLYGEGDPPGTRVELGVHGMLLEYADPLTGEWSRGWDKGYLPAAVRVNLVMADRDRPYEQLGRKAVIGINVE